MGKHHSTQTPSTPGQLRHALRVGDLDIFDALKIAPGILQEFETTPGGRMILKKDKRKRGKGK